MCALSKANWPGGYDKSISHRIGSAPRKAPELQSPVTARVRTRSLRTGGGKKKRNVAHLFLISRAECSAPAPVRLTPHKRPANRDAGEPRHSEPLTCRATGLRLRVTKRWNGFGGPGDRKVENTRAGRKQNRAVRKQNRKGRGCPGASLGRAAGFADRALFVTRLFPPRRLLHLYLQKSARPTRAPYRMGQLITSPTYPVTALYREEHNASARIVFVGDKQEYKWRERAPNDTDESLNQAAAPLRSRRAAARGPIRQTLDPRAGR